MKLKFEEAHIDLLRGAVELLERLELVDERLVLRLEHRHPVLKRLYVLLLLAAALARRFSVIIFSFYDYMIGD